MSGWKNTSVVAIIGKKMADGMADELARVYSNRFDAAQDYRRRVWEVLVGRFFQKFVPESATILDLGCGYGEFINVVKARAKFGMDLNPTSKQHLHPQVSFLHQDSSPPGPLPANPLAPLS